MSTKGRRMFLFSPATVVTAAFLCFALEIPSSCAFTVASSFLRPTPTLLMAKRATATNSITNLQAKPPVFLDAEIVGQAENAAEVHVDKAVATQRTLDTLNPTPALVSLFQQFIGEKEDAASSLALPSVAVVSAALALVLMLSPFSADAAMSGGRMGGSFPSSRQSMSRPSSSYSRGYSSGYRSGFGGGYGSSFYSRSNVIVAPPIIAPPIISPFGNPFFFGAPGVVSYNRGPRFFDILLVGGIGLFLVNAVLGATSTAEGVASSWTSSSEAASPLGAGSSVVRVSVALEVPQRNDPNSILSVLRRLSENARTDSRVGLQNLTSQVALELLRRKSSIVSASSKYQHFGDRARALRDFQSLSIQERAKFEQETVSQYGGVDYSSSSASRRTSSSSSLAGSGSDQATMAVVTLLLAIDGDSTKVAKNMNSMTQLEEALRKIASDVKVESCLQTAEILWTPTDRYETLTMRDVVADYPDLRSI